VTVTAGGAPAAGVTVSLGAAGTQPAQTNAQGVVTFSAVAAGNYTVSISGLSADFACPSTTQPVTVAGGQTTSVTFACGLVQTSSISGSVTNQDGSARANTSITITRTAPAPAGTPVTVTTGANGQYSLTGLRSGTYTVTLPVTANCNTAAITQTVTIAAGEARVVNFTCTTAPPPPPVTPATVAIESITANTAAGQLPVPDNAVAGIVNVNIDVTEGGHRVTRVELWLGNTLVCTENRGVAAPEAMELIDFEITCVVNTAAFNQTTGAPNFRNVAMPPDGPGTFFEARIFTVAGGGTTPAATARRAIGLANVDFIYMRLSPERRVTGGSAQSALATQGLTWWSGNLTIEALPVVYSATTVTNLTVSVTAYTPLSVGSLGVGGSLTRAAYTAANATTAPAALNTVSRALTAAPWSTTLLAANSITSGNSATSSDRGVGNIEAVGSGIGSGFSVSATTIASAGTGPVVNGISAVCSDGRVPAPAVFPNAFGCADAQPPQPIRFDTWAPFIDQLDQALRFSASFTAGCPPDNPATRVVGCASNAITRWIHDDWDFEFTTSGNNSTTPRATDRGTGTTGTFWSFASGRTTAGVTPLTNTSQLDGDTFDNNVFYLRATVTDIGGTSRTMWNNNTPHGSTGTGNGNNSIANLEATNQSKFGRDTPDPCFTANGVDCSNGPFAPLVIPAGATGALVTTGQVIGVAGAPTAGCPTCVPAGGGVKDGDLLITQRMDRLNSAGGDPGWPPIGAVAGDYGHVITYIRREGPTSTTQPTTPLSEAARCWVGVDDDGDCEPAGDGTDAESGTNGSFDFVGPEARFSTVDARTGTVTNRTTDGGQFGPAGTTLDMSARADGGVGFFHVEYTPIDGAGNEGPMMFRRFVRDVMAPITAGVIFPVSVAPAGSITVSSISQDDLALARAEAYLAFGGAANLSFKQNEQSIMAFPTGTAYNAGFPYTTNFNPSATFIFTRALYVGAGDVAPDFATNIVFRIFDHGKNVAEAISTGVPAVNPAPAAAPTILTSNLAGSVTNVCWDTDADGCGTNPNSVSLTFTVTSSTPQAVPFNRVEFYVGRDVNNDGLVDTDGAARPMFASLGIAGGSAVGGTFTWTRVVTGEQLATIAGRTSTPDGVPVAASAVAIRVVGYMPNGDAFTVNVGGGPFCTPAGADAPCAINLVRD
jgi:hypothetical protein